MPVVRLYRLLETGHFLHSCLHCSFLVGLMVFRLFRSLRGIRDDGRALGNPSKMDFSPHLGRAVRRKGCARPGSVAGHCQHQGWEAPSGAGTPLPASRCLHPTACVPLPAPCKAPELPARHFFASPSSLLPWATALAAFAYSQPSVDFEFLMLHFSLSVCQSFLDCRAKNAEPD